MQRGLLLLDYAQCPEHNSRTIYAKLSEWMCADIGSDLGKINDLARGENEKSSGYVAEGCSSFLCGLIETATGRTCGISIHVADCHKRKSLASTGADS